MADETSLRPRPGETPEATLERVIHAVRKTHEQEDERVAVGLRLREFRSEAVGHWGRCFEEWDRNGKGGHYGGYDPDGMGEGKGDEFAPFFSEAFLYNLLGKDEARSLLAIIRRLCVLAEVDFR